jgi:hypothetical protein
VHCAAEAGGHLPAVLLCHLYSLALPGVSCRALCHFACRLRRCVVLLRRRRRQRTAVTNCVTNAAVQLVLYAIAMFVG